jgi:hypothetical protein
MTLAESKETLLRALELLDNRLAASGYSRIEVKIVGGFALILQGVRDGGFTQDIDSMTRSYDPHISHLIAQIGKEMGIKLGWLNADMVLDDPDIIKDIIGEVSFTPYGSYKVLDVSLADLPTLLRLKIVAAGDNLEVTHDEVEYERHFEDIMSIVATLELNSLESLKEVAPNIMDFPLLAQRVFS